MDIRGKRPAVIGGAGLIGLHTVDRLLQRDVGEVLAHDGFVRGGLENRAGAQRDPRLRVYEVGGDVCGTDIPNAALEGLDGVVHFAAP